MRPWGGQRGSWQERGVSGAQSTGGVAPGGVAPGAWLLGVGGGGWGCLTYKVLLGVIPEVQQALRDGLAVLLPLACAEDHLGEVPHPADDRDVGQLLLGQDFGALEQRRGPRSPRGGFAGPLPWLLETLLEKVDRTRSPKA